MLNFNLKLPFKTKNRKLNLNILPDQYDEFKFVLKLLFLKYTER